MGDEFGDLRKKKKKSSKKYSYKFGEVHPGFHIGHENCAFYKSGFPVPARMGWLWDAYDISGLKRRPGWQPGAIGKTIAQMMTFKCAKKGSEKDKEKSKKSTKRKGARAGQGARSGPDKSGTDEEPQEPMEPKPTLRVQRKGDVYTIQINPLKDLKEISPNEDPYQDCDPLILKVIKNRSPEEQANAEARKMAKLMKKRDAQIRKGLAVATEDICKCAYMDVFCNDLTALDNVIEACPAFKEPECLCREESFSSVSSNATWDIEYTPPFGCFSLAPKREKSVIHVETQYIAADAGIIDTPRFRSKKTPSIKKNSKKF